MCDDHAFDTRVLLEEVLRAEKVVGGHLLDVCKILLAEVFDVFRDRAAAFVLVKQRGSSIDRGERAVHIVLKVHGDAGRVVLVRRCIAVCVAEALAYVVERGDGLYLVHRGRHGTRRLRNAVHEYRVDVEVHVFGHALKRGEGLRSVPEVHDAAHIVRTAEDDSLCRISVHHVLCIGIAEPGLEIDGHAHRPQGSTGTLLGNHIRIDAFRLCESDVVCTCADT